MKETNNSHFIDKVVESLRNAAVEMEAFQVKIALGKAEASDKYEEIKKTFNSVLHDSKYQIRVGKKKYDELHMKFDKLMVQLNLGKAETLEEFSKQKKEILMAIHEIEVEIKTNPTLNKMYTFVLIEFEKFKTQLNVLEEKLIKGKEDFKESFENGKNKFEEFTSSLKSKYANKKEETRWEHIQNELSEAFKHFRQAFSKQVV